MMTPRLNSQILIQALVRRTQKDGGFAAVLHKGDATSGAILVDLPGPDRTSRLFERMPDFATGGYALEPVATAHWGDSPALADYIARRTRSDPDLWVIELDVANGEQLVAEILVND